MRILQVSSARAFGGGERHLVDLARSLSERGHEVYAAIEPDSPLREPLLASLPQNNIYELSLRHLRDARGSMKLARFAHSNKIEIVHAHVGRDYAPVAWAASHRRTHRGPHIVITRHVLFPLNRLNRFTLSNVSRVIAVSEAVARALRATEVFDPEKIRVVRNGVDLRRFEDARATFEREEAERGKTHRAFRVGIVGELSEIKNQEDFVRAAALVADEFGPSVEFLIVGDESARSGIYGARLEKLIKELQMEESLRMIRRCEDVAPLIASLDVLVSASRSEAFGMVMAEAAACGVPVVATATEGAKEIVANEVTGLIVPIDDVRALASAVISLLGDEGLRNSLGSNAREVARARFSLERMVTETERVYAEALGIEATAGIE